MARLKLGPIQVDLIDIPEIQILIDQIISKRKPSQIITLNSIMYTHALINKNFVNIINNASIILPDSFGIVWALKLLYNKTIQRIPGIDLIYHLCCWGLKNRYSFFLLGAKPNVASQTANILSSKFPGLCIKGTHHGYFSNEEEQKVINIIKEASPDILLVALDTPKQDIWIYSHLLDLGVPIVIGVGGSFDVISGSLKRAPLWMQNYGLEWCFRFIQQPKRLINIKYLINFSLNILKLKYFKKMNLS